MTIVLRCEQCGYDLAVIKKDKIRFTAHGKLLVITQKRAVAKVEYMCKVCRTPRMYNL
jgi:hypothetical protein